jgi:hypothetical protein
MDTNKTGLVAVTQFDSDDDAHEAWTLWHDAQQEAFQSKKLSGLVLYYMQGVAISQAPDVTQHF